MAEEHRVLEDYVYSDEYGKVVEMVEENVSLLRMAIMMAVRYDKGLLITELMPMVREQRLGTREEVIRDATVSILENAMINDNSHSITTINSIIHYDILNVYLAIEAAIKAGSHKYYTMVVKKMKDMGMDDIPDIMYKRYIDLCVNRAPYANAIYNDLLPKAIPYVDIEEVITRIITQKKTSLLHSTPLLHTKYQNTLLNMTSLIIYSMEVGCHDCASILLNKVYDSDQNIDIRDIMNTAIITNYPDISDLIDRYYSSSSTTSSTTGTRCEDLVNMTILAINSGNMYYSEFLSRCSMRQEDYSQICVAMVKNDMIEEMIEIVDKVNDVTPVMEELVKTGYSDLLSDILDMNPPVANYLPVMTLIYENYGHTRYIEETRSSIMNDEKYGNYITPLVAVYDMILSSNTRDINAIKRSIRTAMTANVDLRPLIPYFEQLRMYDIARYISYVMR
jgi:hypothetical protein